MEHELKTWPAYYAAVRDGRKPFELRKDDREPRFEEGDTLILREWDPATEAYTGARLVRGVSYVLRGFPGVEEGYAILGLSDERDDLRAKLEQEMRDSDQRRDVDRVGFNEVIAERNSLRAALAVVIEECVDGMAHEDPECPNDDTCTCANVARVRDALRDVSVG